MRMTAEKLAGLLEALARGDVPVPGPQNGRYASEPAGGLTSLAAYEQGRAPGNASVDLATRIGDTVKRIDGTEVPLLAPWRDRSRSKGDAEPDPEGPVLSEGRPADGTGIDRREAPVMGKGHPETGAPVPEKAGAPVPPATPVVPEAVGVKPAGLDAPRDGKADDLKLIKGVGPKLEILLHRLGFFHFDQIAEWTADEIAWVDANLEGFRGRVTRDHWVDQARQLAAGDETEFSERVKKGDVY